MGQNTEEILSQILLNLQRAASLYRSGIPLSVLHSAKESKEVSSPRLLIVSLSVGEGSHPDAQRLLHAAVEKGLKRDLSTVLWVEEKEFVSRHEMGEVISLQAGIQVVLCGEPIERERFRRAHQSLLPVTILETVSLLQAAHDQGKKRELWKDLQPLVMK